MKVDYKAPGRRSICAKALMRLRPERWTSTSSERRLVTTLQVPAHNLPLLFTRMLSLSVRHYPLFGRKESVAACRHPYHPSPSPNSNQKLTIQRAYQYLRPKRADHVLSKNFILLFSFLHALFGIRDPGDPGFELLGCCRLCSTFRTRRFLENSPTNRPATPVPP